jgi:hypothetical protein
VASTVKSSASAKAEEAATEMRRLARRRDFFMVSVLIVFRLTIITISNAHATVHS